MVPGKVDEFLCVLAQFEKDPESRTSLELLTRLKPVLSDWPELLRDSLPSCIQIKPESVAW